MARELREPRDFSDRAAERQSESQPITQTSTKSSACDR